MHPQPPIIQREIGIFHCGVSLALDYPLDETIKKPAAVITTTGFWIKLKVEIRKVAIAARSLLKLDPQRGSSAPAQGESQAAEAE